MATDTRTSDVPGLTGSGDDAELSRTVTTLVFEAHGMLLDARRVRVRAERLLAQRRLARTYPPERDRRGKVAA